MTYLSFDLSFLEALECNASALFFLLFFPMPFCVPLSAFSLLTISFRIVLVFLSLSFVFCFDLLFQEEDRVFYYFCTVVEFVSGIALSCFRSISILYTLYCILYLVSCLCVDTFVC